MSSNLNFLDRRGVFARVSVIQASKKLLKLVLTFTLVLIYSTAYANGGIGYKGIKLNLNGSNNWYNVHAITWSYQGCGDYGSTFYNSANSNWNSVNLGSYSTTASLQITGYAVVGWADNGDYVAGKLEYKVWKQGDAEPSSWTIINIGNYQSPTSGATQVVCSSGNDRVVGYNNGTTNFQPGAVGTYNFKLKAYGRVQYTGGGGGAFNDFDGAELTATFTIIATPSITSVSSSTPANSSTQIYKGATVTVNGATLGNITTIKLGGSSGTTITGASISSSQISFTVPDATSAGTIYVSDGTYTATSTESFTNLGFISTGSGNWSSPSTWLGGTAPAANTPITISNSQVLTLDAPATVSSLTINAGGTFENSSNTLTISAAGSLTNNGTFDKGTGTVNFAGAGTVNGTTAITFNNLTINTGALTTNTIPTIDGTFRINGGFVTAAPKYTANSTLNYNSSYNRSNEWSATGIGTIETTAGYPNNVTISSGTFSVLNADAGTARAMNGTLTINAGTTFTTGALNALLTVGGNIVNNGTLDMSTTNARIKCANFANNIGAIATLSSTVGGDLELTASLIDNATFNANTRAIFFTGTGQQDVNGSGTFNIDYIVSNKSSGSIRMLCNLLAEGPNGGNAITLTNTTDILDLNGFTLTIGKADIGSTITGNGSLQGSSTSSLTVLGTGTLGTLRFNQSTPGTTNTLQNLNINRTSTGTVSLGSTLIIGGTLTLTNGTLTVGANTLQCSGSSIVRTNGTIDASNAGSTLSFTNTTGHTLPSSLFSGNINNLTMNGTGGISLGSSTTVAGTLTLTSGNITLGSNQLTVSTISGGGANSYIKTNSTGTLKQNISNAGVSKNFPVGNSAYNPVTITNNTNSADDFSVSVGDGVFANGSTSGSAITNGRVNRTWDISKTSGNSGTGVTLNFLWNSGEVEGTLTDPRLYHYVSSAWNQESGTPSFDLSTRTLTYTNYTGSFSPFYLGEKGSALPVTFTSLTGTIRNGKTNLNWTIADEHNVDRYEVEESANGRQFQSFAQVDAASRSSY